MEGPGQEAVGVGGSEEQKVAAADEVRDAKAARVRTESNDLSRADSRDSRAKRDHSVKRQSVAKHKHHTVRKRARALAIRLLPITV